MTFLIYDHFFVSCYEFNNSFVVNLMLTKIVFYIATYFMQKSKISLNIIIKKKLNVGIIYYYKKKLYVVSRIKQDRQREPGVKTLRSPLSAEFLKILRVEW